MVVLEPSKAQETHWIPVDHIVKESILRESQMLLTTLNATVEETK